MPQLTWIGKAAVVNHHKGVPFRLLRCDPDLSVGDAGTGNLLVEGDNLEALKALLPHYAGQVKCIYIDPPYNTGQDGWIYNDRVDSPAIREWLGVVVGAEGIDLSRHDKWLCMMYPRLVLLREFLRADGLIFVSTDDNEVGHLRCVMDEVFGPTNFVSQVVWRNVYGGGAKSRHVVQQHEYVTVFARDRGALGPVDLPPDPKALARYTERDGKYEARGPYFTQPLATTSMDTRPNLRFPILWQGEEIWPDKQWQWSRERVEQALANDELVIRKSGGRWSVRYKQYLRDNDGAERASKLFSVLNGPWTQVGTSEIAQCLGDGKAFPFPKSTELVRHFVGVTWRDSTALVLDSFAGSGTTGHAVLAQNAEDGGSRRFILVELEPHIATPVTRERLKRVIEGYAYTKPNGDEVRVSGLGGGFRYCRLGAPLFDARGQISPEVRFEDLARHVFFAETGEPLPGPAEGVDPMIGACRGKAIYLLFNGVLKDKRPHGGNVLTSAVLAALPPHDGPRVVYGVGCRLGTDRLRREGIVFKQIPYQLEVD